jgi:hypothetical protein
MSSTIEIFLGFDPEELAKSADELGSVVAARLRGLFGVERLERQPQGWDESG